MSVAKDVGKAIGEPKQTGTTAGTTATQAPGGIQLSQEDIAKITAGLGSLG
ncbi:unnamed protein product [Heligmosomoides polygyrus]|uniref:Peptidylprolyl isomerase n=1 Tax=Heligmosomoides polygyrus TaxID=6339 RepID=A0A183F6B3_HELPZ|nr:unnamed protein product [Heligmosomoides polygyrus]